MRINRIPRLPGRIEVHTAPSPLQLIARALRGLGRSLRRALLTFHIRNARHELLWLGQHMAADEAELRLAYGTPAGERILERQQLDAAQRDFLTRHLARLRAQRAALDSAP